MSTSAHFEAPGSPELLLTIDDIARRQGVGPVESLGDLALDVWESDAELDTFLADVRRTRQTDLA